MFKLKNQEVKRKKQNKTKCKARKLFRNVHLFNSYKNSMEHIDKKCA